MRKLLSKIQIFLAQSAPYGGKCLKRSSTDITDSSDGYHCKCNSFGNNITTMDM